LSRLDLLPRASLLAGLIFSFNPVAIAAIPVSLAYVTKAREKRIAVLYGGMFILGLIVTHVPLGLNT
jgi:cytochrome c-type biogenesis protein